VNARILLTTTLAMGALLAGCGRSDGQRAAGEGPAASAPVTPAAAEVATTANGAPKRADGRWELANIGGGGTVIGTQFLCVDAASEDKASVFDQIARNVNCEKYQTTRTGAGWTFDFTCGPAGMTAKTTGEVSGDFRAAYRVKLTESDGTAEMSRTIEAKRAGDCPAGMTPGDLTDEAGKTITNITD
jgi:hypothetical protein